MTDEQKQEEAEQEAEQEAAEEAQPKDTSFLDEAKAERILMEKANAERKALLDKEEKILAERALGGRASMTMQEPPKVETNNDYYKKVMSGEMNDGN